MSKYHLPAIVVLRSTTRSVCGPQSKIANLKSKIGLPIQPVDAVESGILIALG